MVRKRGKRGQKRRRGEMSKRQWYEICEQKCIYGFARVFYDRALEYEKPETSEKLFDLESVALSRENWCGEK